MERVWFFLIIEIVLDINMIFILVVLGFSNDQCDVIVFIIVKIEINVLWINIDEINVELVVIVRSHSFRFILCTKYLFIYIGRCLDAGMNKDGKINIGLFFCVIICMFKI